METAKDIGLDCLVECHDESEVKKAVAAGAEIIGINNRDLNTFKTDLQIFPRLCKLIPKSKVIVSESGINNSRDVCKIEAQGADAVLVGTSIMKAENIIRKIKELRTEMLKLKICGITNVSDALVCGELGIDLIGINFCPPSPRYVTPDQAKIIVEKVKQKFPMMKVVGIFQNKEKKQVLDIVNHIGMDIVQLHGDEDNSYVTDIKKKAKKEEI